jgi:hypothetical protein
MKIKCILEIQRFSIKFSCCSSNAKKRKFILYCLYNVYSSLPKKKFASIFGWDQVKDYIIILIIYYIINNRCVLVLTEINLRGRILISALYTLIWHMNFFAFIHSKRENPVAKKNFKSKQNYRFEEIRPIKSIMFVSKQVFFICQLRKKTQTV